VRGTISAENANTWTIATAKGADYTVAISPTTAFGPKKAPASAQSFPVGSRVVVIGERTGTTINATRIVAPRHPRGTRGTISAENASTWTIATAKGTEYTVAISPTTAFGTQKAPASAQSFPVGSRVVVIGERTGTTINATRIAAAGEANAAGAGGGGANPSPAPAG